jgi:hypothetical protein
LNAELWSHALNENGGLARQTGQGKTKNLNFSLSVIVIAFRFSEGRKHQQMKEVICFSSYTTME